MSYITGERHQVQLLPASIDEYISGDDPVRVYDAFVEQLDFAQLGVVLDAHREGHPEFDPRAIRNAMPPIKPRNTNPLG